MSAEPVTATTIGDPCGIGPEVVIKALAAGALPGRSLLIGDIGVVNQTIAMTAAPLSARAVDSIEQARFSPGCIDVLDPGTLKPGDVTPGKVSPACGRLCVEWWKVATDLAESGKVAAIVKGPINSEAIRQGSASGTARAGKSFLFLITGPLRVVHLTDHVPLREMLAEVKKPKILELIRLMHDGLRRWGIPQPRIAVAGLNPHAYGLEEEQEIAPAVRQAVSEGIQAIGPVAPDSVFRQCTEGQYDCVLAHYHDQGHIPVKTWRFSGNCSLTVGHHRYVSMTVAHGTAFDIAGKGIADPGAMIAAIRMAGEMAQRRAVAA